MPSGDAKPPAWFKEILKLPCTPRATLNVPEPVNLKEGGRTVSELLQETLRPGGLPRGIDDDGRKRWQEVAEAGR